MINEHNQVEIITSRDMAEAVEISFVKKVTKTIDANRETIKQKTLTGHPDDIVFYTSLYNKLLRLETILQDFVPNSLINFGVDDDIDDIILRGKFLYGKKSKMMKGKPNQCHKNSCELYLLNKDEYELSIYTGYAMRQDGIWYQHSWLVRKYKDNKIGIIETTINRKAYFGFEMTKKEALDFCEENNVFI